MPPALPIDPVLPEVSARLQEGVALVLEAPPGAGKTTRVPPLLLDLWPDGEVLVLEPRRIAAYVSAERVARERGGALGEEVGVQMRYDSVCGPRTRLRYVTEGVLLRRLLEAPELPGVRAVVLDEFHERHLQADLALMLLLRLQRGPRPDLRVVVMSATLDGEPIAAYLQAPLLRSEGRAFPVEISYLPEPDERPLEQAVRGALLRLLPALHAAGDQGHVLVFLPGAAEIRRAFTELTPLCNERGFTLVPLHGDLPFTEQRQAVSPGGGRRVILSTNVAETSVTVPGVTVVIDSGLARVAGHSPWSGLPTLRLSRICRAAAAQRAGRAGRTAPGRCLRLYTRADHDGRPAFEAPEVQRLDLAEAVLLLRSLGLDPTALPFLQAPRPAALQAADELLRRLGALSAEGAITALGRRMARLPLHPRQARLLLEGQGRGVGEEAAALCALLGERDLRGGALLAAGPREAQLRDVSDLLHLLDLLEDARRLRFDPGRLRGLGVDPGAAQAVERGRRHLVGLLGRRPLAPPNGPPNRPPLSAAEREEALLAVVLSGYPDRVARRRRPGSPELLLSSGGALQQAPQSVARDAEYLVVVDAEERSSAGGRAQLTARLCSAVRAEWLLELPGLRETRELQWNADKQRVERVERLLYEQLVIDETRRPAPEGDEEAGPLLRAAALAEGAALWGEGRGEEGATIEALVRRVAFVAAHCPEAGIPAPPADVVAAAIAALCPGRVSFAQLRAASLRTGVEAALQVAAGAKAALLARLAPQEITLPSGRRAKVVYEEGQAPYVASRLQDFFGLREGPRIGGGKVPLLLHLLAPNQRPVQLTSDLAGFWTRHYPAIRRELSRKYPRHAWPEDPLAAPAAKPR